MLRDSMPSHLLDTDHVTLYQHGNTTVRSAIATRLPANLTTTIITAEEQLRGRLAQTHRAKTGAERLQAYRRLQELLEFYTVATVVPFDAEAERKYHALVGARLRVGTQDLKIAAIALSLGAAVVTRNRQDFGQVPGLLIEDWSG
jgi:tRNA(fMet)-specific endonuclease VapC